MISQKLMMIGVAGLPTGSGRGVFAGGDAGGAQEIMDYITISTIGNAQVFGDLNTPMRYHAGCSNGTYSRGVFSYYNITEYITISSTGNSQSFGSITFKTYLSGNSNGTNQRGLFGGGKKDGLHESNIIDYITINSLGNSTDFGDLVQARQELDACSNATNERGVFGGGTTDGINGLNKIDYVTINSTGNATNFGNLFLARRALSSTSNGTNERGVFGGGILPGESNVIDYITINSPSNSTDYGDFFTTVSKRTGTSNGTGERAVWVGGSSTKNLTYLTINIGGWVSDFGNLVAGRAWLASCSDS